MVSSSLLYFVILSEASHCTLVLCMCCTLVLFCIKYSFPVSLRVLFSVNTVKQETFEGENLHDFHSFVAICESFLWEIWGCSILWRGNLQKFSPQKLYFSLICESFPPQKFPAIQY